MNELIFACVAVLMTMGASGIALMVYPPLRRHSVVIMPVILGAVCLALGAYLLAYLWPSYASPGVLTDKLLFGAGLFGGFGNVATGLVIALISAVVAFTLEGRLKRWSVARKRRAAESAGLSFLGFEAPTAAESLQDVGDVAKKPVLFGALSVWTGSAEEFFYRGTVLVASIGTALFWPAFALQAGTYAVSHLAFGWPAILGKLLLGLSFGAAAIVGGVIPVILAHWGYQWLVARQFRAPSSSRKSARKKPSDAVSS